MTLNEVELEKRLGKIEGLVALDSSHIKEIKDCIIEIKEQMVSQGDKIGVLWMDRNVWNWVLRAFVVATPILVVLANLYSAT